MHRTGSYMYDENFFREALSILTQLYHSDNPVREPTCHPRLLQAILGCCEQRMLYYS